MGRLARLVTVSAAALALVRCSSSTPAPATSSDAGADGGVDVVVETGAPPPEPSGCIDDVTPGDHVYTCEGLRVDARVPAACEQPGCGLILELHGDTGTGLLMDGHTNLRDLGEQNGYIVFVPTGPPFGRGQPGSTWTTDEDAKLVKMTRLFASVFRVNEKKVHVTGFSRGGYMTWRLLCDASDLFASAAPGAAGKDTTEVTCFENGRKPARPMSILMLMGRTDASVPYSTMVAIRDAAITEYGATGPVVVESDATYKHNRWSAPSGLVVDSFDHTYETVSDGPWATAKGHCVPGSTTDPYAQQYAVPCKPPNSFVWGEEVMKFFLATPRN